MQTRRKRMKEPAGRRNKKLKGIIKAEEEGQEETQKYPPFYPEEIVAEILSKLPVKSLLRFKCVSKSCRSLISDPKFTLSSISRRQQVVGLVHHQIVLIDDEASLGKVIPRPLPDFKDSKFQHIWVHGSCNGLVIICNWEDLFLWNPSTRICNKVFAQYRKEVKPMADAKICGETCYGLFYDSFTDDYKVLIEFRMYWPNKSCFVVGSFRNKTWTQIPFPYNYNNLQGKPTVNGRLHFLVGSTSSCAFLAAPYLLVYLDPHTYEFVKLPMPQVLGQEKFTHVDLGVLDGCLSMALFDVYVGLQVWTMKKYGDHTSWTKLFVMSNMPELNSCQKMQILCRTTGGEVLMQWGTFNDQYLACNPKHSSHRKIQTPIFGVFYKYAVFIESLISTAKYGYQGDEYARSRKEGTQAKQRRMEQPLL